MRGTSGEGRCCLAGSRYPARQGLQTHPARVGLKGGGILSTVPQSPGLQKKRLFGARFEGQRDQRSEEYRRRDAARRGRQAARERADKPDFIHGAHHALTQGMSKARKGYGCTRTGKIRQRAVHPDGAEQHPAMI